MSLNLAGQTGNAARLSPSGNPASSQAPVSASWQAPVPASSQVSVPASAQASVSASSQAPVPASSQAPISASAADQPAVSVSARASTHVPASSASSANRFSGLDHLRALAIIIVFVYHYNIFAQPAGLYDWLGHWGWTGVDLFFVLSGYLIGGQLFSKLAKDQPVSYAEFYFKRSLRILPAYFVVLALYLIFPGFKERSELPPVWKLLTFTQNFGLDIANKGAFSHAWSLCIEEQFYLFLPLLIIGLVARKSGNKAVYILPGLFIAGFIIRTFLWMHYLQPLEGQNGFGIKYYQLIYYPTWSRLDGLIAGVALAAFYYYQPQRWANLVKKGTPIFIVAILLLAAAWAVTHRENQYTEHGAIFGYPLIAIAYGTLVLAALSPNCFLSRWSTASQNRVAKATARLTRLIATLSYSIYLTHKQLIHLTQQVLTKHGFDKNSYTVFAICTVVCLLGGWALHLVVEKPFLRLRDRWLANRKATVPAPPQTVA